MLWISMGFHKLVDFTMSWISISSLTLQMTSLDVVGLCWLHWLHWLIFVVVVEPIVHTWIRHVRAASLVHLVTSDAGITLKESIVFPRLMPFGS